MNIRDRVKELRRVPASQLQPNPKNWRTHPEAQANALRGILAEVGIAGAVLARETESGGLMLIDGHLRAETLQNVEVPVLVLDVDEEEADKLLATIDPLGAMAEADAAKLDELLRNVETGNEDLAQMLEDLAEQAGCLDGLGEPEVVEDEVPEPSADPITKPGDLWLLGDHRLLCGDSTKAEDVERLMAGAKADLCFTSPPYGQQRDYTEEAKAKVADWDGLMRGVFGNLPMADAGQVIVNLGLIHRDGEWIPYWDGWIEWMRQQGWRRFGWYVWDQGSGLPGDWGGRFAPSHEFLFHFNKRSLKPEKCVEKIDDSIRHAKANYTALRKKDGTIGTLSNPGALLQTHKIPDSVVRAYRSGRVDIGHPATFSIGFAGSLLQAWLGLIYEPFCGSGTTLIAAEQLGRKCYGMEISPQYCDVIVKRWETLTGRQATREEG